MASEANARVLSGFLDYLRIEKGLARLSIAAYTTDIGQFAEFLEKRKRVLMTARRNDVREFLQQLFGLIFVNIHRRRSTTKRGTFARSIEFLPRAGD